MVLVAASNHSERIVRKLYLDVLCLTFSNANPLETTKSFLRTFFVVRTADVHLNHFFTVSLPDVTYRDSKIAFSPLVSFDWFRVAFP